VAVAGDASEKGFGLSAEDRAMLVEKVSIFFHSAASVRFDDPIKKAIGLNLRGTFEALKIAEDMKQLVVRYLFNYLHISKN